MSTFESLYNLFSQQLIEEISQIKRRVPEKLYDPIIYSLNMGGKRIRPVMLLMSYEMFKTDIEKALPAAVAIELFHNFTLLHDDIMDEAGLRRNLETVHVRYSNNAAILSGDAMSILSYEYIIRYNHLNDVVNLFTQTALKICEGQQFDMDFESRMDVSVDEYLNMIGLKTAVLLAASLKLGANIAEAPEKEAQLLYEIGYNLGLAFQLQDDLLDTFGDQKTFGKNIGGDIVSNKKTFLLINALELATEAQLAELKKWLNSKDFDRQEKIDAVKKLFVDLNIYEITKSKIDFYFLTAKKCWEQLNLEEHRKEGLLDFAVKLMDRQN
ncbi:MAG TPA: polyprenyl synthetase family protein [Prolixibacteraceae bacterium]|nr:polyprenyl synthetase family protein [Prolixibacteraceae bacterium]